MVAIGVDIILSTTRLFLRHVYNFCFFLELINDILYATCERNISNKSLFFSFPINVYFSHVKNETDCISHSFRFFIFTAFKKGAVLPLPCKYPVSEANLTESDNLSSTSEIKLPKRTCQQIERHKSGLLRSCFKQCRLQDQIIQITRSTCVCTERD